MNRIIVGVVGFIVEVIFTVIITNILGINTIAQIPLGILIGFSLFSLSILIALLYMYFTNQFMDITTISDDPDFRKRVQLPF